MDTQDTHIIIRPARVMQIFPVSRTTLWRLEREDPAFPKAVRLGANSKGFWLDQILVYAESKTGATNVTA
jgi:predicted DNA-binding transcriptional regulator AlpA